MHKARLFVVCAGLLGLALLLSRPAAAAWPHDPNNGNVALCTATGQQDAPAIVSDGAGGAIVTWHDYRSGGGDIYVQRISAAGTPQWTADGVALCTATGNQQYPTIVSDGAGGAIVTWGDRRSGTHSDIYAQRISAAGTAQWTANGVALCAVTGDQQYPTIVSDGAGGAIVTWEDSRSATSGIYAQRISAAGSAQWTANGVALCTAGGGQYFPAMVSDGAGGAIVTWQDYRSGNLDIYAQRILAAGTVQWPANGWALCTATGSQESPAIASDGAGGAIVTWNDSRSAASEIYAQRISAGGSAMWLANGVALCTATGDTYAPTVVSDGTGGAIVTWMDYRSGFYGIYAQRISAAGSVQWAVSGVALCTAAGGQESPAIVSDGGAPGEVGSGAIVTWFDYRSGTTDIYAQRISAAGTVQWTANGVALCTATGGQFSPTIVSDGGVPGEAGSGAIVTWSDSRSGLNYDIYAQRIEKFGKPGSPEPAIASVLDIPNDQGGRVRLAWDASYLDREHDPDLTAYDLFHSAPPNVAQNANARGASRQLRLGEIPTEGERAHLFTVFGTQQLAWEYVSTVNPQHFIATYGSTQATTGDSIAGSNPTTSFMVVGRNDAGSKYWLSAPAAGYSVDNLAPPAPAPFTGQYASGTATLHWAVNPAADLGEYRLYRGSTAGFVPGPANLVAAQPDTGYVDAAGATFYYKLCAVDVHGNASGFSTLLPSGTVDVPGGGSLVFALEGVRPNPSHGERLSVTFTLPTAAPGKLELVDVSGRRVAEHEVGPLGAGQHTLDLGAGRHLAPGFYLVRLTQGANTRTTRVAVLH
jgi:hypothetical protein